MSTTPKSGLRYPASTATPNVPGDLLNLATDLDWVGANYASTAARDAANPSPAAGDECRVAGRPMVYAGSAWQFLAYTNAIQSVEFLPSTTLSTTLTPWFTFGTVTVPVWATSAMILGFIDSAYNVTAVPNTITLQTKIGTAGGTVARPGEDPQVLNQRFLITLMGTISGLGSISGSQTVTVVSNRTSGTGAYFVDNLTHCFMQVIFS